uniref:MOSC domain-containing protein n=1 Tax=Amblyomma sculptum TaxID=1581419 RepID=A0A1E1XMJ2_AMBSC
MLIVRDDYFVSMREEPRLGMIRVAFDEDMLTLTLTVDGYPPLTVNACSAEEQGKPLFTIRVRKFSYKAVEVSQEASEWFRNYLKHDDVRLVGVLLDQDTVARGKNGIAPVACQDESSFQVLSKESLEKLLSRLPPGSGIQRRNFRPTLFVEGCEPHAEDHWKRFRISDAEMAFLNRTTRCVLTTVNQDTGDRTDKEPLVTLRKYRIDRSEQGRQKYQLQPLFGIGSIHIQDGRIAVGDEVYALQSPEPLL